MGRILDSKVLHYFIFHSYFEIDENRRQLERVPSKLTKIAIVSPWKCFKPNKDGHQILSNKHKLVGRIRENAIIEFRSVVEKRRKNALNFFKKRNLEILFETEERKWKFSGNTKLDP